MRNFIIYLLTIAFCCIKTSLAGDAIQLQPGMWSVETTMNMSALPEPRTTTSTECLEKGTFEAQDMVAQQQECSIENSSVQDNVLTWDVVCKQQGSKTTGSGVFTANNGQAEGTLTLITQMDGQDFESTVTWKGTYQGPCN